MQIQQQIMQDQAAKKCPLPIRDWKSAVNQSVILFPDRAQV